MNSKIIAAILARIKGTDEYDWLVYTGKEITVMNDAKRTLHLQKGDKFGVRPGGGGKKIRLITEREGPNKVFTVEPDVAQKLAKDSKPE
jgi:hypothetical protein